ncbi:MAG: tetratricopeptide repeat protein [Opitutaceae bacterium]|jgi:TPR repeat protein
MKRFTGGAWCPLVLFISAMTGGAVCSAHDGQPAAQGFAESGPIVQLKKDAEQGDLKAQYVLGCCYNGDHGFTRDPAKAAKWWGRAAAGGYAEAQFCLGLSCFIGEGVPKDTAEATRWWRKAADQEQPDAQYFLGLSYHTGLGVPKNARLAVYWLKKSAGHGSKPAAQLLKTMGPSPG